MPGELMLNSEIVCIQTERVFTGLVDNDDYFSENPTVAAVVLCLMDRLCVREKSFFPKKKLLYVAAGTVPASSASLFPSVSCRCHMKGS